METWYILTDGSVADPRDVSEDDTGALRHKDGLAVSYRPSGPRARMVSADEADAYHGRQMVPEKPKRTYKTRQMKAKD